MSFKYDPKRSPYIKRLVREWMEHGKIIIACDFDDTIKPFNQETEGLNHAEEVIDLLIKAVNTGAYLSIFTSSSPDRYQYILDYCEEIGLKIDSINENPVKNLKYGTNGAKMYANIYLDDRGGLLESLFILESAMYVVDAQRAMSINSVQELEKKLVDELYETEQQKHIVEKCAMEFIIKHNKRDENI